MDSERKYSLDPFYPGQRIIVHRDDGSIDPKWRVEGLNPKGTIRVIRPVNGGRILYKDLSKDKLCAMTGLGSSEVVASKATEEHLIYTSEPQNTSPFDATEQSLQQQHNKRRNTNRITQLFQAIIPGINRSS